MTSISLEDLTNEVLYRIIVSVEFSYKNFQALTLTCHQISDLMRVSGGRLLEDIAAIQYPHALEALQYPKISFCAHSKVSTIFRLDRLRYMTDRVEGEVEMIRKIRAAMLQHQPQLVKYLATKGWDRNLRNALHFSTFPSLHDLPRDYGGLGDSKFRILLDSLPTPHILAYRHAALMVLEASKHVETVKAQWDCTAKPRPQDSQDAFVLATRQQLQRRLPGSIKYYYDAWMTYKGDGQSLSRVSLYKMGFCYDHHTHGLTQWVVSGGLDRLVEARIQNVLTSWDQHVAKEPVMIDNLAHTGGTSLNTNAIRELVQSFVDAESAAN
jgi:hypothetical protein